MQHRRLLSKLVASTVNNSTVLLNLFQTRRTGLLDNRRLRLHTIHPVSIRRERPGFLLQQANTPVTFLLFRLVHSR